MKKYKRGITFGAFDPIHIGHIKLFERAKEMCDELIVFVSTKEYIEENKKRRERYQFKDRIKSVSAIKYVDQVSAQGKTSLNGIAFSKEDAVSAFNPDVIFVGDDWTPETFTGEGLGVKVEYLPYTKGVSSTLLFGEKMI